MLNVEIATRTGVGARPQNEDDLRFGSNGTRWHAVLADGAGGHLGGAVASDMVVRLVTLRLQSASALSVDALVDTIRDAHDALGERQQGHKVRDRMHSTVVALWVDAEDERAVWAHVGDSRLYMLRRGRICHVTRDDSLVQQLVDAGYVTPAAARDHPRRNQLVCALGSDEAIHPHAVDQPQTIQDGDAFLMATDGWWESLDGQTIESTFAVSRTADDWLALMESRVRLAAQPNQDNYSAIAVWVGDPSQTTRFEEP